MEARPHNVVFYMTEGEECPFELWLESLRDRQARARIKKRLDRIETGNLGDFKMVGAGVMELRIDYGQGYRIYFAQAGETLVLLLCGGVDTPTSKERGILPSKTQLALTGLLQPK